MSPSRRSMRGDQPNSFNRRADMSLRGVPSGFVKSFVSSPLKPTTAMPDATLVTISDVTRQNAAERERDDLLRQKDMLIEEMQHRIANSLQIVASILMLKARGVVSDEAREHLDDARVRVLAVAALQRHLHVGSPGQSIALAPYFAALCESLSGALIRKGDAGVKLKVEIAEGSAPSGVAVSLGLIVTELVINSLKARLSQGRTGRRHRHPLRGRWGGLDSQRLGQRLRLGTPCRCAGEIRPWNQHRQRAGRAASGAGHERLWRWRGQRLHHSRRAPNCGLNRRLQRRIQYKERQMTMNGNSWRSATVL